MPKNGKKHKHGSKAAIYLEQPGANTRVRSWCPTPGPQYGFLVTHNESISIADFFTVRDKKGKVDLSPDLPLRLPSLQRRRAVAARDVRRRRQGRSRCITCSTSTSWSTASTSSACCSTATTRTPIGTARSCRWRRRASWRPIRTPPGMQVTSAVLAGMVWALENPEAGIVEADEMDYRRCLEVQLPYLGPIKGYYTDWTPLDRPPWAVPGRPRRKRPMAVPQHPGSIVSVLVR